MKIKNEKGARIEQQHGKIETKVGNKQVEIKKNAGEKLIKYERARSKRQRVCRPIKKLYLVWCSHVCSKRKKERKNDLMGGIVTI